MAENEKKADDQVISEKLVNEKQDQLTNKDTVKNKEEELINSLDSKYESLKALYDEKLEKAKKEMSGVNRSNSELQKKVKEYEMKEMTEKEKFDLESRDLKDEWSKIWKLKALSKYNINDDESDFSDYLSGDSEDEIVKKAEKLKMYIDNKIKKGIEIGVEDRIKTGYVPKSGQSAPGKKSYSDMTAQELTQEFTAAIKENNENIKTAIFAEQKRRMTA